MSTAALRFKPTGSRRFWLTVLCFAVANAGTWVAYDRVVRGGKSLLEVTQSAPVDQSVVYGRPTFWWTFNLDVTPTSPDQPPGSISPQVPGKWRWDNPRTLAFTPDEALPRASVFRLTLQPERLRTPAGFRLNKPFAATLFTQHLDVLAVRQTEFDEQDRLVVEIEFNDDVVPAEVLKHLKLASSDGRPLAFQPHGDAVGRVVRVLTDPVPAATSEGTSAYVKVQLAPGLTGRGGPLGMAESYQCNLPIGTDLVATETGSYFADHNQPVLTVRFNNQIDLAAIKPLLSVTPSVPFTLTSGYNGVELHGPFQPATRYAIKIAKAPAGVKRTACPRPETLSVYVPDRRPSFWFEHDEGYLGSSGNRTLLAHAVNVPDLRASVARVYDNNLVAWRNGKSPDWREIDTYSRPMASKPVRLPRQKNVTQEVRLSLDDLLPAGAPRDGVYLVTLDSASSDQADDEPAYHRYSRGETSALVTLSDIGLTAKRGRSAVTVWATSLRTAESLSGVRVRLYSNKNQFLGEGTTASDGLATITPATTVSGEGPSVLLADRPAASADAGRDLTWLDLGSSRLNFGEAETGGAPYLRTGYEAFLYTDRGVYRPGETVHLRAIVRGPDGVTPPSFPVTWRFRRPDLHNWQSLSGQIDSDGAVSLDLPLPDDLPTGRWSVALGLPGNTSDAKSFGATGFQVEDFMPNRMQVALKLDGTHVGESQRFMVKDEPIDAIVQADYLFGRPVAERPARLIARIDPAKFAPPKWEGWTFGDTGETLAILEGVKVTGHRLELPEEILSAEGRANFSLDLHALLETGKEIADSNAPPPKAPAAGRGKARNGQAAHAASLQNNVPVSLPWRLTVTASVIEAGGRAVSTSRQADLDSVARYVGLRNRASSVSPSSPSAFDVALVSPDGQPSATNAELTATLYRENWNNSLVYEKGRYVYHPTRLLDLTDQKLNVSIIAGNGSLELQPPAPGSYVLRVCDATTGCVTSISFYAGEGSWQDNISRENPERLELLVRPANPLSSIAEAIRNRDVRGALDSLSKAFTTPAQADRDGFRPGQGAQVIVRSPFAGRLLLSVETDDLISTRVIDMPQSHLAVPIDVTDACCPNAYVTATVVRTIDPDASWRTHRAFASIRLPVDNTDRKLIVQADAPPEIRPGTSLSGRIRVTDASGAPVQNAAATIAVVDEGICQLTGFRTPDPLRFFTRDRALGVEMADLYSQLMPEVRKPDKTSAVGGDKGYDPRHTSPISARRVKPVAMVSRVLHTDANGFAQADFNMPQFTGKLRLMAVASAGRASGSGETAALVRTPLLVQSSWPRFAAPGDKFLVPLVVFNNSSAAGSAAITLHVIDGPLHFGNSRDLKLPAAQLKANGQTTQLVEVNAAQQCGVSHVTLTATLGDETYSESVELPVRPPSPEVTLGGYAVATPDKPTEISLPGGILDGTARLEVKITPWPTLQLPQGLDYLERYPYGCLEQTTSTLFPLVYLSDVGQQIAPGVFEKDRVTRKVQAGITRLIGMQTASGGLSMWPAYRDPWPWGSIYAAHFLVEAQNAGFSVPEDFRKQLLGYVRNLLNQSSDDPDMLSAQTYACYVLALAGSPERAVMSRLAEVVSTPRPDKVSIPGEARFHLAAAWLAAGRRDLAEGLIPQTLPPPRETRSLAGSLASPVRDRAILTSTLLAVQPDHPALPGLVQQLVDAGNHGQWRSTQDTAFAVLALGRYLRQSKSAAPYDSAELLMDGQRVGNVAQAGVLLWNAGVKDRPLPADSTSIAVRVTGAASVRAHVAWLEHGVPLTPPKASDHGMSIRRGFLNEHGKPIDSGRVRSGDLVQIELSISSPTALQNLVIDDLLPAGLEIENPRLKTSAVGTTEQSDQHPNPFQDTRLDMRDDRLILMGNLIQGGTGTYVYTARAVTPGTFVLPPVHAECMYDSGTNSISGSGRLEVVPVIPSRVANLEQGD